MLRTDFDLKERRPDLLSGTPRAHAVDRWIFVFMAAWYILIVLTGFIPDSVMKVQMVEAGARPAFPLVLHMHAVAMGSFLLLLLAQSVLMATGRCERHKKLGIVAFALVPVIVIVGFVLAPTIYHQVWNFARSGPPALRPKMQQQVLALDDILLLQIRARILFPVFMVIALKSRGMETAQADGVPGAGGAAGSRAVPDDVAADHISGERAIERSVPAGHDCAAVHVGRGPQPVGA